MSRFDDKPVMLLDYQPTSRVASSVRDEIREVGRDRYLGIVFILGRPIPVEFFLDFSSWPAPRSRLWNVALREREPEWIDSAPVVVNRTVHISAPPDKVFALLADHESWPCWFSGMRGVRIDGASSGTGALRTVRVGASRVQERFLLWEEGRRLALAIVRSNVPGLVSMTEDWALAASKGGTELRIRIGVEPIAALHRMAPMVRYTVARATRGAAGIAGQFEDVCP